MFIGGNENIIFSIKIDSNKNTEKVKSRELTSFEKSFLGSKEKIQYSVKVSKTELIPKIIQNLKHYILGFHLKLEDTKYVYQNNPIELHQIPKNIETPSIL